MALPPAPPPGTPATFSAEDLAKVSKLLDARKSAFFDTFKNVIGSGAIAGAQDILKTVQDVYEESLRQANQYEREIVDKYGDISTQQETFGKSAAKLAVQNTNLLRQEFLQLEESGIKMMDAYQNADEAAAHASEIMDQFQGSAYQFMDDLEGSNLRVVQLLSRASGLSAEQTGDIMKLAKARGEDSKQMLADIGTFSKALSDKFSLDTKVVAEGVAQITTNVSTFGKVSVEAATAASARFAALGLSVTDVAESMGRTFGNFSSAADASAKLSQVLGVNIDAMQLMVDVNSGPEGMNAALERMRENVIGAGVDVSQLSAPMIRTFKEITGITEDKTLFAMFDPERAGIDADAIMEEARKAAEAQKTPTEALKLLDGDIGKFKRNLEEMTQLVSEQNIQRLGTQAQEAALGMADLSSSAAPFFDGINQFVQKQPAFEAGIKSFNETTRNLSNSTTGLLEVSTKAVANDFARMNPDAQPLYEAREQSFNARTKIGQGAKFDQEYLNRVGVQLSEQEQARIASDQKIVDAIRVLKSDTSTTEERSAAFREIVISEDATKNLVDGIAKLVPSVNFASLLGDTSTAEPAATQAGAAAAASAPPAASSGPAVSSVAPPASGAAVSAATAVPTPAAAPEAAVKPVSAVDSAMTKITNVAAGIRDSAASAISSSQNAADTAQSVSGVARQAAASASTALNALNSQVKSVGSAVATASSNVSNIALTVNIDVKELARALVLDGTFAVVKNA